MKNQVKHCPNCNSRNVNKVTKELSYCMECSVEFSKDKVFTIMTDGTLVNYFVNDFSDCG